MKLDFYDINVEFKDNKVYGKDKKLIYTMNFDNQISLEDFIDIFEEYNLYLDEVQDNFKLNETYYIIQDDNEIFGVISLNKGWTFIDCAEHDDRVIIKSVFPELKCNIIGEK